jgi:serine protease Do
VRTVSLLRELSDGISGLVASAAPSVVGIERRRGQGSGVVLAQDGYVLTNAHVAAEGPVQVRLSGSTAVAGELVGVDQRTDLAVVRAHATGLPALALADGRRLRVGELVVAIGNPLGFDRSVTLGVVSALHRSLPTPQGGLLDGLVQTDAAVNPGNSGGPLLDVDGQVVGITSAMIPYARGIGLAIPSRTAAWVAAVLIQHGQVHRPFLGVSVRGEELEPEQARRAGQTRALRVLEVESGTPAEQARLDRGDLLLAVNGSPIDALDDLQRVLVLAAQPEVELEVLRGPDRRRHAIRPRGMNRAA